MIQLMVSPNPIYIERGDAAQYLNFDIVVENQGDEAVQVVKITLSVFDEAGVLVLRRFLDQNGFNPSIWTVPQREVGVGARQLLFNPFYVFDHETELHSLEYELVFEGGETVYEVGVTVQPVHYETRTDLILPLEGRLIVYDGHDFYAHHRRLDYLHPVAQAVGIRSNFMRYGYDFCHVDGQGAMYQGDPGENEAWLCFGKAVQAPGAGRVVAVVDEMPDNRRFDEGALAEDTMVLFGNYIVIDHENGEYSLCAHLQQGSAQVQAGDVVAQGAHVANVGASGSANIPHLHYELRDGAGVQVEGVPSTFRRFRRVRGSRVQTVARGQVDTGDIVERESWA